MVYGCHIATCLHCHKRWMVGDCIPDTCQECTAKGHRGWPLVGIIKGADDCPVCIAERDARLVAAQIASEEAKARDAARKVAEEDMHRQRPWPGRKAKGFRRGW